MKKVRAAQLAAAVLGMAISQPAVACRLSSPIVLEDVRQADVVIVGRVFDYRVIRDEAFRKRMLSQPNLSADLRETYLRPGDGIMSDYARFEVQVDEVLTGQAPRRLTVAWDNSTFGEPETLPPGPFLIALRRPSLASANQTLIPNPEPGAYTPIQGACSAAFIFKNGGEQANTIRRILSAPAAK